MGHGPSHLDPFELGRHRSRLHEPDPNGKVQFVLCILENHDRCLGHRIKGKTPNPHLDKVVSVHITPLGLSEDCPPSSRRADVHSSLMWSLIYRSLGTVDSSSGTLQRDHSMVRTDPSRYHQTPRSTGFPDSTRSPVSLVVARLG